jgi:hypothetical protein
MSRLGTLRKWVTRSARSTAKEGSDHTEDLDKRTEDSQSADGSRDNNEPTPSETPHCPTCTCHTLYTETPFDLGYLAYDHNNVPYGQAGIQVRAHQTATAYITGAGTEFFDSPKALREFSYYAHRLSCDLGVSECPSAMRPWTDEDRIADGAARTIFDLGGCPTVDAALEHLVSYPNHLFADRLRLTAAAISDATERVTSTHTECGRTSRAG